MEGTSDDPPTSTVVLDSYHFSQVIFTNVEKFYIPGADVTCHYNLSEHITPRRKDWVGIFKVGWKTTREYYTFMWAPLPSSPDSAEHQVLFKAYYLPKDDEYYQFCYVDQDGIVRGASVPFQFHVASEDDMLVVTTQGEVEELEQQNKSLLQENQKLKETLTNLQKQNEDLQEQIVKAQETAKELEDKVHLLQSGTMELQRAQDLQALEMSSAQKELAIIKKNNVQLQEENQDLKRRVEDLSRDNETLSSEAKRAQEEITCLEVQNSDKEAELHQMKEKNQKLLTEKEELENKLKAALGCVDELQVGCFWILFVHLSLEWRSQAQKVKKELEKLKKTDGGKAKLLEEMKEENKQLHAALLRKNDTPMTCRNESVPAWALAQSSENAALVFGNPYCGTLERPDPDLVSLKTCPICNEIFLPHLEEQYSDHVRSHILNCPYCEESFDESNKQVYDDHVYCHGLD
ncbi:calcium-binding and coiled-coil domain-containing protein 2 [Heteronotia binoei]|uniref:calcium-binding and coiled-coil domain-containing protein 2 n=1 Tax=Heteronotia binoei TaxID=13085 RepID=UPI00292FC028|nr:calcium-binding and coiled-coil domain-containing protein 2 [Heteronotia binoei]